MNCSAQRGVYVHVYVYIYMKIVIHCLFYLHIYIYLFIYLCILMYTVYISSPSRAYLEATESALTLKYHSHGQGLRHHLSILSMSRRISNFTMVGSSLNWCSSTCPKLAWISWHSWKMILSFWGGKWPKLLTVAEQFVNALPTEQFWMLCLNG